jgi:hypothetical protein
MSAVDGPPFRDVTVSATALLAIKAVAIISAAKRLMFLPPSCLMSKLAQILPTIKSDKLAWNLVFLPTGLVVFLDGSVAKIPPR